jgi:hypothetical protein
MNLTAGSWHANNYLAMSTDDRLLWLTVAIGLAVASLYIPATLRHVRKITEVHEDDDRKKLSNDAEAALKPEVLRVLVDGPSHELRASAIKIVAGRSLKDDGKKILLRDLASNNAENRVKAINAMHLVLFSRLMVNDSPMTGTEVFCDLPGFTAIVDALVNCLPLHKIAPDPSSLRKPTQVPARGTGPVSPLLPPNRPADETRLMQILQELLRCALNEFAEGMSVALQAGVVKRWLKKYPFPCASPSNSHLGFNRSDVVSLFRIDSWASDDPLMLRIMVLLGRDPEAMKQLRAIGIRGSDYKEAIFSSGGNTGWSELPSRDILMTNSEDTAGVWSTDRIRWELANSQNGAMGDELLRNELERRGEPIRPGSSWARQAPERSPEEQSLRRRNREAIVVADGGTPFTRDNILRRQNSGVGPTPLLERQEDASRAFDEDFENARARLRELTNGAVRTRHD